MAISMLNWHHNSSMQVTCFKICLQTGFLFLMILKYDDRYIKMQTVKIMKVTCTEFLINVEKVSLFTYSITLKKSSTFT